MTGDTLKYVLTLLAIIAVIAAAYYVTYFIAARGGGQVKGRHIRIRERFALSRDKMLCIAELNGKLYFIALTNGGIELLDKLDVNDFNELSTVEPPKFMDALKKAWETRKGGDR